MHSPTVDSVSKGLEQKGWKYVRNVFLVALNLDSIDPIQVHSGIDALEQRLDAMGRGLRAINLSDFRGWFRYCEFQGGEETSNARVSRISGETGGKVQLTRGSRVHDRGTGGFRCRMIAALDALPGRVET